MPRINVEEIFFKDTRYIDLCILMGSKRAALGATMEAWIVAQEYWKKAKNGIPKPAWKNQKLADELITVGLAREVGDFIYVAGSDHYFGWLWERKQAGRSGGLASSAKRKSLGNSDSKTKQVQPSSSSSSSSSSSFSKKRTKGTTGVVAPHPTDLSAVVRKQTDVSRFIGAYVKSYQGRYGPNTRPEIDGKAAGIAKSLVASLGCDRASELIQVYLQLDDKWFKTKSYDLGTFKENLNKIALAHATGLQPDKIEANRADEEKWKRLREAAENDL